MLLLEKLDPAPLLSKPYTLTIGNFDGVHLGHQKIVHTMRQIAGSQGTVCVLTFSNHPSQVLSKSNSVQLIYSKSLKMKYLEELGVDVVYCLEFTAKLAELTYAEFLKRVQNAYPFEYLILGQGASLGKNREGTADKLSRLGEEWGFQAQYLPKCSSKEGAISSGEIRRYIQRGLLKKAAQLLGRPFQIEGKLESNRVVVSQNQCLPPEGSYPVIINAHSHQFKCLLEIQGETLKLHAPLPNQKIFISFE